MSQRTTDPNLGIPCVIVSGLGRCGSSLAMQMLQAGGMRCVGTYPAFEHHATIPEDLTLEWVQSAGGWAFKLLDPQRCAFRFDAARAVVILLRRDPRQQAESMAKFSSMVVGLPFSRGQRKRLAAAFASDLPNARAKFSALPLVEMRFEEMIEAPIEAATRMRAFLYSHGFSLDAAKAARVVRPRSAACYPGLLEATLLEEIAV